MAGKRKSGWGGRREPPGGRPRLTPTGSRCVGVLLTPEQLADLGRLARARGESRSATVRRIVELFLAAKPPADR